MLISIGINPPAAEPAAAVTDTIIIAPSTVTWLADTNNGTLHWKIDSGSTPLTTAQIQSGTGLPSGSLAISSGTASGAVNLSAATTGNYYFHAFVNNTGGDGAVAVSEQFYLDNG